MTEDNEKYTVTLDDDPMVHKIVEKSTGFKSLMFDNPEELSKKCSKITPVAAFVDIHLGQEVSGLDIVPTLRKNWPYCPILVITASPTESTISRALSSGADDFIRKPIIPEELTARLQLRLNDSAQKEAKEIINFGDISIDYVHRKVVGPKGIHYGSPIEINLLTTLANTEGALVEKENLKLRCWGQVNVTDNALHRRLHAVRRLLKDVSDKVVIQTKYGVGFLLAVKDSNLKVAI